MSQGSDLTEKQLSTEEIYHGRLLHVYKDAIALPNGATSVREYIRHSGAVCIVALTENRRVPVVRQYRYPMGSVLLEIPAGKLDGGGESPEEAARRELKEETGATVGELVYLGPLYPTPAYTDEVIHMFWAKDVVLGEATPDEGEFLTFTLMPLEELTDAILRGEVPDAKTQTAVLRAVAYLNHHES